MRLNQEENEAADLKLALSDPHFEEEWTVLSARQVVPIAELEAKAKRRYSLRLVAAFVLASSLGVLVALASIRLRELNARIAEPDKSAETAVSTTINDSTSDNADIAQTTEESAIPSGSETTDETSTIVNSKSVKVSARKHPAVDVDFENKASDDDPTESSIDSKPDSKPEPRLVDQWQEGRPRRTQPRRLRNDDGAHHPRDLRDLDEIFEGSPKKP